MSDQPHDQGPDETVDDDDQDSEPTMMAPQDRRPDGTVADLHEGADLQEGEETDDGSGEGGR